VFLEPQRSLHFQLIGLILIAGLAACSTPSTSQIPNGDPSKTSTVEGTLGTGLETDIELFSKPGLRIQESKTDNLFTGNSVVAVAADGSVLGSSEIDNTGKFSLKLVQGQTVALALASKGPSGNWLCQQPLQYVNNTTSSTAALKLESEKINAGSFTWKAKNGLPSSETVPSTVLNNAISNAFTDTGLNGFMRCGNPNALETTVLGDYDLVFPKELDVNDPARTYAHTFAYGLDTSGPRPRFKGSAKLSETGKLEMRVRHEAGQPVKLAPIITDERPLTAGIALMPTWNLGLPTSDVVQTPQLGKLTGEIVLASGTVQANDGSAVSGANINWAQVADTSQIALGRGLSGLSDTKNAGSFSLLVPKRSNQTTEAYAMNIIDPLTLEKTSIDVSVIADPAGAYADFSRGGDSVANGVFKLEKPMARHVVLDLTYVPSTNAATAKLTYLTGSGSTPFQTITPINLTAFLQGSETVLNMKFTSNGASSKDLQYVFAQVAAGTPSDATENGTNVGNVDVGNCNFLVTCNANLTKLEFAQGVQPASSATIRADATNLSRQVTNAGQDIIGITPLSPVAFPVRSNDLFGMVSSTLQVQLRWPTVNSEGRNQVKFRLNFLVITGP
jgi:hypothetical protein